MTRRIRRTDRYSVVVEISDEHFLRPPRDAQRGWLLNRAIKEFGEDLEELDGLASRFARGSDSASLGVDRSVGDLSDEEIMEDWQIPLMERMAGIATATHGDVLEVGFGRGVSASMIQDADVRSHTIVECNESVIRRFYEWKKEYPNSDISLIEARWQDAGERLGEYDAVFFHTYPLDLDEYVEYVNDSVTFAESFFETAANILRPGGVFTYLSNEIDSLSRSHQRLLLRHFREFAVSVQRLDIPDDVVDTWWADSMTVVKATK